MNSDFPFWTSRPGVCCSAAGYTVKKTMKLGLILIALILGLSSAGQAGHHHYPLGIGGSPL